MTTSEQTPLVASEIEQSQASSFSRSLTSYWPFRFLFGNRPNSMHLSAYQTNREATNLNEEYPFRCSREKYGYLEHIQSYRPYLTIHEQAPKKKVRQYYQDQIELIHSLEKIIGPKDLNEDDFITAYQKQQQQFIQIVSILTLIVNIILVIVKVVAYIISRSLSILSSVVDSGVDLLIVIILMWTDVVIKKRDGYKYPTGRTRLEPVVVVISAVIMCAASVEVIFESIRTLSQDVDYFSQPIINSTSCLTLPFINMSTLPIAAMVITIVTKAILFILCNRFSNPTMQALAEDNCNDVVSNITALLCGTIGSLAWSGRIDEKAVVVDPIGAIIISIYIIIAWILQGNRQVRRLTGITAEPILLQRLNHIVYNYRPDVVTKIDTVRAAHYGTRLFVEVDIVLPGLMPLTTAHDIGAELQQQLETLEDVERAFVHLDYETFHSVNSEHKLV